MRHSRLALILIWLFLALYFSSCNKPAQGLPGEYISPEKQNAHMVITADTIQADVGQLYFKVKYKILSTSGADTMIEMDDGFSSKAQATITQNGDTLTIRNNYVLNGTWKRK